MNETSQLSGEKYLELVRQSRLVAEERLDEVLQHATLDDAVSLGAGFVEQGLLTPWQDSRLQRGKWRGFHLGRYQIMQPIGQGGMGRVYLGKHTVLGNQVAIKVLARNTTLQDIRLKRFQREAMTAAQMSHPNIARTFDVDCDNGTHFIVMEYVEGLDINEIVRTGGTLDFRQALEYTRQVAIGLAYAHKKGVIHRDIKPANLRVTPEGCVKILDFGLARLTADEDSSLTMANEGRMLGTADYLAPEQAMDSHSADGRADIYSLGHSLYFMFTGRPPFPTGKQLERIMKHCTANPEPIEAKRPDVPAELVAIWTKMTRRKAKNRYETADQLASDIEAWLNGNSARISSLMQKHSTTRAAIGNTASPTKDSLELAASDVDLISDLDLGKIDFKAGNSGDENASDLSTPEQSSAAWSDALGGFEGNSSSSTVDTTASLVGARTYAQAAKPAPAHVDDKPSKEDSEVYVLVISIVLGLALGGVLIAVVVSYLWSFFTAPPPVKSFEKRPGSVLRSE